MAKLDWKKVYKKGTTQMGSDYYSNPKTGFDKAWHTKQAKQKAQKDRQIRDKALQLIRSNKAKRTTHKVGGPVNNTTV